MANNDLTWIDQQLRDVAVPAHALDRLREIAALGDRELDHLIRAQPLPAGVMDRLRVIGTQADVEVDQELQHVGLPDGLIPRLRRGMKWQVWRTWLAQVAVAASLMLALGGSIYLLGTTMQPLGAVGDPHNNVVQATPGARDAIPPSVVPAPGINGGKSSVVVVPTPHPAPLTPVPSPNESIVVTPINSPKTANHSTSDNDPVPDNRPPGVDVLSQMYSQTPDLRVIPSLAPHGVSGPRVRGYDLMFEQVHGVHPAVQPAKNSLLRESRVPIWTATSSYEATWRAIRSRQPLIASQVRVEDFLAAMDYDFPPPQSGELALRTAGGPYPFAWAQPTQSLLQIGAQAGKFHRGLDVGVHLTLAVDASAEMLSGGRWDVARRSIADLAEQMTSKDRLTIVVFDGAAKMIAQYADRQAVVSDIIPKLNGLAPRGVADVAVGLELAAPLSYAKPPAAQVDDDAPARSNRLVLLTDGLIRVDSATLARSKKLLAPALAAGVALEVIDVRADVVANPQLRELAQVASVEVRHAPTLHDLNGRLRAAIAGRNQVVADSVSLKVNFNPEAVESYRLIGHDATSIAGLEPGQLEGELRAEEAATALYVVELKPDGSDDVATVELSWREPGSEQVHRIKQPVGRLQFAPSWMETPLSLQTAAIAAETAEILRGSYYLQNVPRALDQVADLARQANPALQNRASFFQLKSLIDAARAARISGPARGA